MEGKETELRNYITACLIDSKGKTHVPVKFKNEYFPLLNLEDLRRIISTPNLEPPKIRLVRERTNSDPRTLGYDHEEKIGLVNEFECIQARVSSGSTLVISNVDSICEKCNEICELFSKSLGSPYHANLYWSQMPVPGFGPHADAHNLFAYQALGSKTWRFPKVSSIKNWGEVIDIDGSDTLLREGEILYVKSGTEHDVLSRTGISVHLTISKGVDVVQNNE